MRLLNSSEDLQERVREIGPRLEQFIREKRPAISKAVRAPFKSADGLAKNFTDSSWLGEWSDVDNY